MLLELTRQIPDLSDGRTNKKGYRDIPIDSAHPLHFDPLVSIAEYGICGRNYYSRPNRATGDPVPGVSPDIYVRRTVAEKLAEVNRFLQTSDAVAWIVGEHLELNIGAGYRSPKFQEFLYNTAFPAMVRREHPAWTEEEVTALRDLRIAAPTTQSKSPPNHATAGAIDTSIQYLGTADQVFTGYGDRITTVEKDYPDFLEHISLDQALAMGFADEKEYMLAQAVRRITYNAMSSEVIGGIAMAVNPMEVWHYSWGDQLWAQMANAPCAIYGYAQDPYEFPETIL